MFSFLDRAIILVVWLKRVTEVVCRRFVTEDNVLSNGVDLEYGQISAL